MATFVLALDSPPLSSVDETYHTCGFLESTYTASGCCGNEGPFSFPLTSECKGGLLTGTLSFPTAVTEQMVARIPVAKAAITAFISFGNANATEVAALADGFEADLRALLNVGDEVTAQSSENIFNLIGPLLGFGRRQLSEGVKKFSFMLPKMVVKASRRLEEDDPPDEQPLLEQAKYAAQFEFNAAEFGAAGSDQTFMQVFYDEAILASTVNEFIQFIPILGVLTQGARLQAIVSSAAVLGAVQGSVAYSGSFWQTANVTGDFGVNVRVDARVTETHCIVPAVNPVAPAASAPASSGSAGGCYQWTATALSFATDAAWENPLVDGGQLSEGDVELFIAGAAANGFSAAQALSVLTAC
jgi:hypothetical protein